MDQKKYSSEDEFTLSRLQTFIDEFEIKDIDIDVMDENKLDEDENTESSRSDTITEENNQNGLNKETKDVNAGLHTEINDQDNKFTTNDIIVKNQNEEDTISSDGNNKFTDKDVVIIIDMEDNLNKPKLISDHKINKKPEKPILSYKTENRLIRNRLYIQISTLGILVAIIISLISAIIVKMIKSERINVNLSSICDSGYCYMIEIKNFQKSDMNDESDGDFIGLANSLYILKNNGIRTIIITDIDNFTSILEKEELDKDISDCLSKGFFLAISFYVTLNDFSDKDKIRNILKYDFTGLIHTGNSFDNDNIKKTKNMLMSRTLPIKRMLGLMPNDSTIINDSSVSIPFKEFNFLIIPLDSQFINILSNEKLSNLKIIWHSEFNKPTDTENANDNELGEAFSKNGLGIFSLTMIPNYMAFYAGQELFSTLESNYIDLYTNSEEEKVANIKLLEKVMEYITYFTSYKCRKNEIVRELIGAESNVIVDQIQLDRNLSNGCNDIKYLKLIIISNNNKTQVKNLDIEDMAKNEDATLGTKILYKYPIDDTDDDKFDISDFSLNSYQGIALGLYEI